MTSPIIDEVGGSDATLMQTVLSAGLPAGDLASPGLRFFRFSDPGGQVIGFIGWEPLGAVALLRSLVVLPQCRGQGWGRAMTAWALEQLTAVKVAHVYLVTIDRQSFAERLGFSRIDRTEAPPAIQLSRQLLSLCPATAALMHKATPEGK
jgi:N-acetylglutamate synthase-like GNAT family acetyltransferase